MASNGQWLELQVRALSSLMPLVMKLEMKLVQDSLTGLVLLGCLRSIQTGPGRVIPRGGKAWQLLQSEDL